jgi:hypothetical protein
MWEYEELKFSDAYKNHLVFEEIDYIRSFYDSLSYSCSFFMPNGILRFINYTTYVYTAINGTLESIYTLLKRGLITDAYVLLRKYFDDILLEIYINVILKDKYNWDDNLVVKEVEDWLKGKYRIPSIKKLLKYLKTSENSKDLYQYFAWDTELKRYREILDDCVHGNRYNSVVLNCNKVYLSVREHHLKNFHIIIKRIFAIHLAFVFYLNPNYLTASDYVDYLDCNETPPEGSENWIASFAQEAFDKYIKNDTTLADFIKKTCYLEIK